MINFLKYTGVYIIISLVIIGIGAFSALKNGYIYSIDFVGGTDLVYQSTKPMSKADIKKVYSEKKLEVIEIRIEGLQSYIRSKPIDEKQELQIRTQLTSLIGGEIKILRFETVGPVIGKETLQKTLIASLLATIGILLYMSFAFKGINYAIAAIVAMVHDFLVVVLTYSVLSRYFGAQIDTMFVTAVLTTMSFSVHDTIVIFDKIREYLRIEGNSKTTDYYANRALTETMVRSLNNSMTIVFMLLALILMGGTTIRFFVATLLIGTITGTYSSPFIATPLLVWLEKKKKKN